MADERLINIVHPGRKHLGVRSVPASLLDEKKAQGWVEESFESEAERGLKVEADFPGSEIAALASGIGRTASFGGVDIVNRILGQHEEANALREENKPFAIGGEILGAFSPIGGPALAAGAGRATARAIGARLGEGVGAKVVSGLGGAVAEGATFGLGTGISENALAKDDRSIEAVIATLGAHALFGGIAGGVVSGALAGGSAATLGISKLVGRGKAPAAVEDVTNGVVPSTAPDALLQTMRAGPKKLDRGLRAATKADAEDLARGISEREAATPGVTAAETAEHAADLATKTKDFREWVRKADVEGYKVNRRANNVLEGKRTEEYDFIPPERVPGQPPPPPGEVADADILKVAGDPRTVRAKLDRFEAAQKPWQEHFGATRTEGGGGKNVYSSTLDDEGLQRALGSGERLNAEYRDALRELAESLRPVKKYEDTLGTADALLLSSVRRSEEIVNRVAQKVDDPLLTAMRSEYERLAIDLKDTPEAFARREAQRFVTEAEKAGFKVTDKQLLDVFQSQNPEITVLPPRGSKRDIYGRAQVYGEAAKRQLAARTTPPAAAGAAATGLKQQAMELGGDAAGWLLGGAFGGFLGGFLGGKLGRHLGARVGRAIVRPNKMALAIHGARREVEEQVSTGVGRFIAAATGKSVERAAGAGVRSISFSTRPEGVKPKTQVEEATLIAHEVSRAVADPMGISEGIWSRLPDLRSFNVFFYDRVEDNARKIIAYLASMAPEAPTPDPLGRRTELDEMSEDAAASFMRRVAAADNPIEAMMDELAEGMVTPETAETVRELSPALFAMAQDEIMSRVREMREDLPTTQRVQLSLLFDIPVDPSMEPGMIAFLQGNFMQPEAQPRPVTKKDIGSVKTPQEEPTPAQKVSG